MVKGSKGSKAKAKLDRQGTQQESEILTFIDERFEELEETIILASLVPQLHERLHAVEKLLKMQDRPLSVSLSRPQVAQPKGDDVVMGEETPRKEEEGNQEKIDNIVDIEEEEKPRTVAVSPDLVALSPIRRNNTKRITEVSKPKIDVINERTLDTQTTEYYTFGESTWDLVVFIGTGALGPLGSLQTVVLAIVNVLMQVVFCAIAWFNFTSPDINEESVTDMLRWRRSSGHAFSDYSPVARESLVQRVCKQDKSLESSGIQVDLVENIEKYLKSETEGLEGWFTGQILCIVALICWYLMVAKEVSHALALHRGIMAVPRGPTHIDTRENPFTQATHYRLRSVAARRKLGSFILLLYRLLAAVLLVWVGTNFLVYTVSVTELILNAVALGIILDIDDLLFDALATTPGRHLVHQLDPLHMPSMPRIRGADAKSIFMSIFIPGLTILVYITMLGPFVNTLDSVRIAMCGGNQAFVWTLDKRRVTQLAPTVGGGWEEEESSIKTDAIVEGETSSSGLVVNNSRFGVWVTSVSVLDELSVTSLDTLVESNNPNCGDSANQEPMLNYLRYFLGNTSVQSCADAQPYCDSITKMPEFAVDGGIGYSARMLCSRTCGCQNPGGKFINVQGCPFETCVTSQNFERAQSRNVCIEKSADDLKNFAPWQAWIQTIRSYGQQTSNLLAGKEEALLVAQAMEDNGCGFDANLTGQNLTLGGCFSWNNTFSWTFKTLEVFCPVSCGCSWENSDGSGCPKPFGQYCMGDGTVSGCVNYENYHLCPGKNATSVDASLTFTALDPFLLAGYEPQFNIALQHAIAEAASDAEVVIDPGLVVIAASYFALSLYAQIYTPRSMNATAVSVRLFDTSMADLQAAIEAKLVADDPTVPVSSIGFSLSTFSNPGTLNPYGGAGGYGDGPGGTPGGTPGGLPGGGLPGGDGDDGGYGGAYGGGY